MGPNCSATFEFLKSKDHQERENYIFECYRETIEGLLEDIKVKL